MLLQPVEPTPPSIAPAQPFATKFLDIHPCEISRQLCLFAAMFYFQTNAREYSEFVQAGCVIKGYKCPALEKVQERFDEIGLWLASEIVLTTNNHERAEVLKRWILVAEVSILCH